MVCIEIRFSDLKKILKSPWSYMKIQVRKIVITRAVSRHDLSHQLVSSRTNSYKESFPGDADYPTYLFSILVGKSVERGIHFWGGAGPSRPGRTDLARFARVT